jgi:hypothetical protein
MTNPFCIASQVQRLEEIERMHKEMANKYAKIRQLVATRNQAISATR